MRGSISIMEAVPQLKLQLLGFSSSSSEEEEELALVEDLYESAMSLGGMNRSRRLLSKQLSMRETSREAKWEKRRRQILNRQLRQRMTSAKEGCEEDIDEAAAATYEDEEEEKLGGRGRMIRSLTDEDLDELRGSIELGFGFDEENGGQNLCDTLPALDLYFAVNRQLSDPKLRSSPLSPLEIPSDASSYLGGSPSPRSPYERDPQSLNAADSWKICNPGDNPQHVKAKLRQWAQVVACSVRQCC